MSGLVDVLYMTLCVISFSFMYLKFKPSDARVKALMAEEIVACALQLLPEVVDGRLTLHGLGGV